MKRFVLFDFPEGMGTFLEFCIKGTCGSLKEIPDIIGDWDDLEALDIETGDVWDYDEVKGNWILRGNLRDFPILDEAKCQQAQL